MFEEELVKIGKTLKVIRRGNKSNNSTSLSGKAPEIELVCKAFPAFDNTLLELEEIFLWLDNNKVRYISPIILNSSDSKIKCRFIDPKILKDLDQAKTIYLAVDNETYQQFAQPHDRLIGMDVFFEGNKFAEVTDTFHNKAHNIVVAETIDGKEILLPDVEKYVIEKDFKNNKITFANVKEFIEI